MYPLTPFAQAMQVQVVVYFMYSPKVDNHNQLRQYELALEKAWGLRG